MATESLTTPLLLTQDASQPPDAGKDKASRNAGVYWPDLLVEAKKQLVLAGPMICVNLFQCCLTTVAIMFVGHLDELSLASASICTSFAIVTGYSVMFGLASALETLCGQAYGAKQYRMLGVYLQRGVIIQLIAAVLVTVLWVNMSAILKLVGQEAEISDKAGEYALWLIPYLYAHAIMQPMQRFLQTQAIILPMMLCSGASMIAHIFLCWLLVFKLHVGFLGAALATSICVWINACLTGLYIQFSPRCLKTWTGFSIVEAWQDKATYSKLAIPSTIMVCLEWWSFEFLVIASGLLPNPQLELSALSICLNTLYLAYMIPFGLSTAASTRVSNELGAGHPFSARFAVLVALILAAISCVTISSTLFSIRNVWGGVFSNEEEVVVYVENMMPILASLTLVDGLNAVLSGVARGCGWQEWGAWANLGAYYIVGLPAALTLAFVYHLNGRGLWLGMGGGLGTQLVCLSAITLSTNWNRQVENAQVRITASAAATLPVTNGS